MGSSGKNFGGGDTISSIPIYEEKMDNSPVPKNFGGGKTIQYVGSDNNPPSKDAVVIPKSYKTDDGFMTSYMQKVTKGA